MLSREERLSSSVKTITNKCEEMFKDAERYNLVSLHNAMAQVKESIKAMEEEFEKRRYDELSLQILKESVERNAIILEYYLQSVCSEYRDTYQLRCYVEEFVKKVIAKAHAVGTNVVEDDLVLWATYARFAIRLKRKSQHIEFYLSKEDREMIDDIEKQLSE